MTNTDPITIRISEHISFQATITYRQVSNSHAFVEIWILVDEEVVTKSRGWRIIEAPYKKSTFKLDAPAYRSKKAMIKSVVFEGEYYKLLSKAVLEHFIKNRNSNFNGDLDMDEIAEGIEMMKEEHVMDYLNP